MPVLIYGKQDKTKQVGIVSDFCPSCLDMRTFFLVRILRQTTVYFISTGEGIFRTYIGVCSSCGFESSVDPFHYRTVLDPSEHPVGSNLEKLTGKTHPDFFDRYGSLIDDLPSPSGETSMIKKRDTERLLRKYEDIASSITKQNNLDWTAGGWILANIILPGGLFVYLSMENFELGAENPAFWPGVLFAVLLPVSIFQGYRARYRILNNRLLPDLVDLFSHFSVRGSVLKPALQSLRDEDLWIGYVDGDQLLNRLSAAEDPGTEHDHPSEDVAEMVPDRKEVAARYGDEKEELEREKPLRDSFRQFYPEAEKKLSSSTRVDLFGGIGCVITLLVSPFLYGLFYSSSIAFLKANAGTIAIGVLILMAGITIYFVLTAGKRYREKELQPALRRKIRSTGVGKKHLDRCLKHLKSLGLEMAKQFTTEDLLEE